jgi:EAL domain-containing protein (putative c-di-GMP-specific phosphodiesterase class I)/CHASE2 domain-containing sensor protein
MMRDLFKHAGERLVEASQFRFARYLVLSLAFAASAFAAISYRELPAEAALRDLRDTINTKPASGEIVLVEIDAASLKALDSWPWPRSHHAKLVDVLTEAGAEQILFDVDFSSRSSESEDAMFADAIERAGGKVVLPTFRQPASTVDLTAEIENLPIESLRRHAFLGSVNVRPDKDGQVNTYPYGTMTDGIPRPSIGALLADANGPVNKGFELDHSIDIATIPRFSFVDILEGEFSAGAIAGKKVIVGATAIEMGDRYATSRFGVVPGVLILALAGETLIADMALPHLGPFPLLLCALVLVAAVSRLHPDRKLIDAKWALLTAVAIMAAPLLAERSKLALLDVMPAVMLIAMCLAAQYLMDVLRRIDEEGHIDRESGLPNLAAWQRQSSGGESSVVVVAHIANLGEVLSTLNEKESKVFLSAITDRLRLSCGSGNLFRAGHDSFCWKQDNLPNEVVESAIEGTSQLFNSPLLIAGRPIRATVIFGAAVWEAADPVIASNKAALAAKRAVETGSRFAWYSDELAQNTDQSLFIISEFESALRDGQVFVVYQPKFDVHLGRVTGAEALARWHHGVRGNISPAVFVPILERENLVASLTYFVFQEVVATLEQWNTGGQKMGCAVNVSASLLTNAAFVERALEILSLSGADLSQLTIEITETAALASLESAEAAISKFSAKGIKFSIDDYGTGQSTLSYLKNLSATEIKIDQSFIRSIATSTTNQIMVRSTIEMAHALGFKVVAEGAEDEATVSVLQGLGCDVIQGWYIGKPVSKEEFSDRWSAVGTNGDEAKTNSLLPIAS